MNRKKNYFVLALCVLVSGCGLGLEPRDEDRMQPFGDIIKIDNRSMHVRVIGEGAPTVLFFSDVDMYGGFINWNVIQDDVGTRTKTVCFDRYGYFWSDEGKLPRTGERIASEIEALLEAQGDSGPFVLVCHGMGGIYGRIFAGRNIEKIAGMVFLDPLHPDALDRMKEVGIEKKIPNKNMRILVWVLLKLGLKDETLEQYGISDELYNVAKAYYKKNSLAWFDEMAAAVQSIQQAKEYDDFGDIPLHILTSENPKKIHTAEEKLWVELQRELLGISRNSKQTVLEGVGHYIHMEEPKIVIASIDEMVENHRSHKTWISPKDGGLNMRTTQNGF